MGGYESRGEISVGDWSDFHDEEEGSWACLDDTNVLIECMTEEVSVFSVLERWWQLRVRP